MLARRLATILPAMNLAEALETTRIQRVAGLTGGAPPSSRRAPAARRTIPPLWRRSMVLEGPRPRRSRGALSARRRRDEAAALTRMTATHTPRCHRGPFVPRLGSRRLTSARRWCTDQVEALGHLDVDHGTEAAVPLYRILRLDGGGLRGVFTARLLARLEEAVSGWLAPVDLIAGTSTGGILALGLAAGLSPEALVALYRDHGAAIFDDSWLDDLQDLGGLSGAQYDHRQLKRILTRIFEQECQVVRLVDLGPHVLIPSFDLDDRGDPRRPPEKPRTWKPKCFHNYPGADADGQERIVDVALRTSAAPTYFPSYEGYIDGGVVANNPAMAAVAQALHPDTGHQPLADLRLLSVGTGANPTYMAGRELDWGYAQWAQPLIELMSDGVMGVADYQCRQILGDHYHRLSRFLEEAIPLDAYANVATLLRQADATDIADSVAWLRQQWA
jgi:uncharacterized protein